MTSEQLDNILRKVHFEHSYHEDSHRYPREFWHVRASFGSLRTDWYRYGEQECYVQIESEKLVAEHIIMVEILDSLKLIIE